MLFRSLWYTVFVNEMIMRNGNAEHIVRQLQNMIKANWIEVRKQKDLTCIQKFQYWLLSYNFSFYKIFYKLYCKVSGK